MSDVSNGKKKETWKAMLKKEDARQKGKMDCAKKYEALEPKRRRGKKYRTGALHREGMGKIPEEKVVGGLTPPQERTIGGSGPMWVCHKSAQKKESE